MRLAIVARRRESFCVVPRSPEVSGAGAPEEPREPDADGFCTSPPCTAPPPEPPAGCAAAGAAPARGARAGGGAARRSGCGAVLLVGGLDDVLLADAAADAGAGQRGQVHA